MNIHHFLQLHHSTLTNGLYFILFYAVMKRVFNYKTIIAFAIELSNKMWELQTSSWLLVNIKPHVFKLSLKSHLGNYSKPLTFPFILRWRRTINNNNIHYVLCYFQRSFHDLYQHFILTNFPSCVSHFHHSNSTFDSMMWS